MKVYAKAGEHILLGSSAIGKGEGAIGFRAPNGASESYKTKEKGRIDTRAQELAGPNYNGTITAGFTPIDIEVEDDQEGVWEIYFMSPTFSDTYNSDESTSKYSIENWSQNNNDGSIMAFDISVCDAGKTKLIAGRAFTNVLNMNVLQSPNDEKYGSCWYSNLYILTNAGYTYRVNTNGQNPHYGAFFSNNKGLQKVGTGKISTTNYIDPFSGKETGYKCYQDGEKSYKSMPSSLTETGYIYDPRMQDNRIKVANGKGDSTWKYEDVTHKIFFCQPANDLPESAKAVYGTTISDTWLKTAATEKPKMDQLSLQGKEANTNGLFGPEGMQITFSSTVAGSFRIQLDFDGEYETKIFEGTCITGINRIDWDGKDGKGKNIAFDKDLTVKLSGELTTAEVHFPFTDLENNENGFILELIDKEGNAYSDVIYWDDSEVQANEEGTDGIQSLNGSASKTGAHKWMTSNSSGNDAIIDTWSYVKVNAESSTAIPTVHFVDLAVSNVKSIAQTIKAGDEIAIQMQVENLAKSDIAYNDVTLNLTDDVEGAAVGIWVKEGGFHVTEVIVNESDDENCKVSQQPNGDVNAMGYISLQNGKKATITVKGYADETLVGKSVQPQAFIMRPGDIFEIDAENLANDGMPNNPIKEYAKENNNVVACQTLTIGGGEKPCDISVKCDTILYGQTFGEAIVVMTTADTTATGEMNGQWVILSKDLTEVKSGDLLDAGVHELTFSYNPGLASDFASATITKEVVVLPRTITLTSGSTEREYDGTAISNEGIEVSGDGFYGSENVVANNFATLQNVGEKENEFEISYTNGAKEANYNIVKKPGTLKVTPKELFVTGVKVNDKNFDGSNKAEIKEMGLLNGVIEGDEVEIESATAQFISEEIGTDSAVVSFTLKGADAFNYIVKEATVKATILNGDETDDDNNWIVANPTLPYGEATVGVTEKAEYKNPAEDATVSYELDGVPAKEGDLIPAGNHTIKVVYIDPATETTVDTTFTCEVSKRPLTVEGSKSEPKVYDGNTDATLAEVGTLNGVLAGDEVTIDEEKTTATFDTPAVGTGKDVNIAYELAGKDADNYEVDSKSATINDGVITAADADWTITNPTLAYGDATVGGTEKAEYKNPAEDATVSYELDGVPAKEGDKIPAGNHTIKVVYTDPTTETSVDTTFTCEVTKRPLTVEGAKSEPKVYDGNTDATLAEVGTLNGVLAGDEVTINEEKTTATFDTPAVGTGKDVNIAYELAGKDADNYEVDSKSATINDGVITAADADWTITNPTLAYGEATVGGTEKAEYKNPAEDATVSYELDGVPAKEGDKIPAGNHTIKVVYTDPTTGFTAETTFDCAVSKKPLAVEGAKSEPKVYDGNTDATLAEVGTLNGVLAGDEVTIDEENTTATFDTPAVGTGKDVNIAYELAGKDADNYEVDSKSATINDGVITAADADWTITNPTLAYGEATVGGTEKAEIKNPAENATIAYELDGVPAKEGDLIPAGNHTIKVVYTDPATETTIDTTFTCEVTKRPLTVEGAKSEPKVYDGNTDATLAEVGTLNGVLAGDEVTIDEENTTATFDTPAVGTGKDVNIAYELAGKDADNYEVDSKSATINDGVITAADADWTITNPTLAYGEATVGGTEKAEIKNPAEGATISYELDGVPAKEGDKIPAGNHTIKVVYTDPTTETSVDTTFTCEVTKRPLTVEGAKSEPKVYDGNTDATLAEVGTLNGVLAGDEVTIDEEKTTATFDTPAVGTGKDVNIAYELAGKDADNYEVDSKSATINDGVITAADADWTITNPTLAYGEATVGGTEKAEIKNPAENATIAYELDGVPAKEGDLIPAGNHTIKVVYTDPTTGFTAETTFDCAVSKKPLAVEGATSTPKEYDGNTNATLSNNGTLVGVEKGDDVVIAKAQPVFETPSVGTGKNVAITYTLGGKDLENYEFVGNPVVINDGVITKLNQTAPVVSNTLTPGVEGGKISGLTDEMEISQDGITWTPVTDANATLPEGNYWVRYAETENANASSPTQVSVASGVINMVDAENFIVDVNGYCPESEGDIMFQVIAGNPTEFRASIVGISEKKLENTAYQYLSEENKFSVYIPMCDAGSYTIQVQFRNEAGSVSPVYNFPIDVNLAAKYINNIWEDVVSIINKNTPELDSKDFEKRFVEFQWYRDNEKIEGATMPYYNEKGGLNGVYYASVTTADNRHLRTCTREWHFTYGLTINVYPNPVVDKANVTLSIDNGEEHELVVTDMSGINIYRGLFTGDNTTIDCSSYGNGWYVIRVDNAQIKIIKE
ncbi:MAG: YDG domain-containing protein [Paludibacteraceae bacterium]|nr:YDG domain-containing protein [Paludibacteraceae bacterium]